MSDPTRIPRLLDLLDTFWRANPDLRLGQIVDSAAGNGDVFLVEDDAIEAWLRERVSVVRRNCWTCAHNRPDNGCDVVMTENMYSPTDEWILAHIADLEPMPSPDADGCPGWRAKA